MHPRITMAAMDIRLWMHRVEDNMSIMARQPCIVWNDAYRVGHTVIDAQHRQLVGMINALSYLHSDADAARSYREIRLFLDDHFAEEGRLMHDAWIPDASDHNHEHDRMLRAYEAMVSHYPDIQGASRIMHFLTAWLATHTASTSMDRRLAAIIDPSSSRCG